MDNWIKAICKDKAVHFMPLVFYPAAVEAGVDLTQFTGPESAGTMADVMVRICEEFPEIEFAQTALDVTIDPEAYGCEVALSRQAAPRVSKEAVSGEWSGLDEIADAGVHTPRQELHYEAVRLAKKRLPGKPVFGNLLAPFTMACSVMPLSDAMIATMREPEKLKVLIEKCVSHVIERAKAYREAGADGLILDEMSGSIIPPKYNAELSSAYVRRVVEAVQTPDFPLMMHNCGRVEKMADEVFESGCRMYSFGNGNDLASILEKAPDNCLVLGNYDPIRLVRKKPEDVYKEVTELLASCGGYPQFVLAPGCDMSPTTKKENVEAMIHAMKDFNAKNS